MQVRVKICGITQVEDALLAAASGVHFIGTILEIEESPRAVPLNMAREIITHASVPVVLLLEKSPHEIEQVAGELKPFAIQLVRETALETLQHLKSHVTCKLWQTMHLPTPAEGAFSLEDAQATLEQYHLAGVDAVVLDTRVVQGTKLKGGGTGQVCDWNLAQYLVARAQLPIFLAGGIRPDNALEAITAVQPYGIDLSSGVEMKPGKKDPQKISALMNIINHL